MSNFVERLKECMKDEQINQFNLSEKAGMYHSCVSGFISGKHLPSYDNFAKLLYVFNCSADYLLGLSENQEEKLYDVLPFAPRFNQILKERKISKEKFRKENNVSASVMYKWCSGKSKPSVDSLIKIAEYFDCSVDYLIGRVR